MPRTAKKAQSVGPVPLDRTNPDAHLNYLVAKVAHRLNRAMERGLEPEGVTPTQFYALSHISRSPGLSSAELARRLLTSPQAVGTLIQRLAAAGLIERSEAARGLSGTITITPEGQRRFKSAAAVAHQAETQALSVITASQQAQVATILQALLDRSEGEE